MGMDQGDSAARDERDYVSGLEERVKLLTAFVDNAEAGMYVTDYHTGEILFANRKMIDFGGNMHSINELIGMTCWKLLNSPNGERCSFCPRTKLVGSAGELLEPYTWEQYFPDYGSWLKIISRAILWPDGRVAQMNTFFDITETKRMQEQIADYVRDTEYRKRQHDLQEVLDKLPIPVRIMEQESARMVYVNDAYLKLFEYESIRDVIGRPITDFLPVMQSDGTNSAEKADRFMRANESFSIDLEYITAKGKVIDGRVTICVIDFNGRKSTLGIITNLEAEKEQQKLLMSAADKEREANQLKSSFLSNMSHEVRTPMNAIIGLTDIELNKHHPNQTLDTFRKINSSARNLLQIANDILDLSKIEANKMELFIDEFELEEVLDSALLVVAPRLEGKRVELLLDTSLDLPRYLVGDRTRLWQVMKNYLDNAAKYTQFGSIILSVAEDTTRSSKDYVWVSFTVRDTGIGMDEEQMRKAFLPYEQVYNEAQRRYAGTGLGMPISKRLCELMGGILNIESRQGQGTVVSFSIPFTRSSNEETERSCLHSLTGLRVLAIDDAEFALGIIGALLDSAGAEYTVARSGEEALDILHDRKGEEPPFDVILLDYLMDGINGLETAKRIQQEISSLSKLLMITSYESSLIRCELPSYGIDDVIEKPYVPSQFIQKIRSVAGMEQNVRSVLERNYPKFRDIRVLICEDNEINQEVAVGMLEQFGISAVSADNGRHGIDMLNRAGPFDLILMDLHMPVMDGFEATREIRSDPKFDNVPIISLTADAMTEVIEQCMGAGMNGYLSKPIEMDQLNEIFIRWFPSKMYTPEVTVEA